MNLKICTETDSEKKPEIISTIEGNYRIARRVYQQLHIDSAELFAEFIRPLSSYELQDMDEDIRTNGWGIKKIGEVSHAQELMRIFHEFLKRFLYIDSEIAAV